MQVVWVMKQEHIGDAFFDLDAAAFLLMQLDHAKPQQARQQRSQHADGQNQVPPGDTFADFRVQVFLARSW